MKEIDVNKLYELAGEEALRLEEGLYALSNLTHGNYQFKLFLENPLIPAESKKYAIKEIFPESSVFFREVAGFLIEEGLDSKIVGLAEKFSRLVSDKKGIVFVNVKTPYPLTKEQKEKIKQFAKGDVYMRVEIDPNKIGGIELLSSDGWLFDNSIQGGIEQMKEALCHA